MLAALRLGPREAYAVSIVEDIEGRTGRYTTLEGSPVVARPLPVPDPLHPRVICGYNQRASQHMTGLPILVQESLP